MSPEQQAARDAARTAIHEARFTRVGAKPEPMIGTDFEYADALAEAAIRALRATPPPPPAAPGEITQEQARAVVAALREAHEALATLDHMNGSDSGLAVIRNGKPIGRIIEAALAGVPRS